MSIALRACKCASCGALFIPPKYVCSECGNASLEEVPLSGRGVIRSHTTIRVPPTRFKNQKYYVAVIELEEGIHVTARVVAKRKEIAIDTEVLFIKKDMDGYWFKVRSSELNYKV